MEDRFKFRVWDNSAKKIKRCAISETGVVNFAERGDEQGGFCIVGAEVARLHYIDVMQCIGLKDKNGELIYEGDIIKYKRSNDAKDFSITKLRRSNYRGYFVDDFNLDVLVEFEIIGNIYENPELTTN